MFSDDGRLEGETKWCAKHCTTCIAEEEAQLLKPVLILSSESGSLSLLLEAWAAEGDWAAVTAHLFPVDAVCLVPQWMHSLFETGVVTWFQWNASSFFCQFVRIVMIWKWCMCFPNHYKFWKTNYPNSSKDFHFWTILESSNSLSLSNT